MAAGVSRVYVLDIPVDVVSEEDLPDVVERLYALDEHRPVVLLDFHELMRSRRSRERKAALNSAALILPVSSLIVGAARFLNKKVPALWHPYPFVLRLLGLLESSNKSVYLLGSGMKGVRQAEATLRRTFPGLRIVGRYAASFPEEREQDVVTAVKKAAPALLLAGRGLQGRGLWLSRKRKQFAPGLSLYEESCFDVFSGRRARPADGAGARFFKGFFNALIRPWRFFRVFRYLFFFLLLLVYRLKKK